MTGKYHAGGDHSNFEEEDLHQEAKECCRERNKTKKGFTAREFLVEWMRKQEELKEIKGLTSARKYLHRIGFKYGAGKAGKYFDGHERPDVITDRKKFTEKVMELAKDENVVFVAQDESVYHAKDGIRRGWGDGNCVLKKKGNGKGIMVSAWMTKDGVMKLSDEEWEKGKERTPNLPQSAFFTLKFGKEWGYYDWPKFERDLQMAITIAEVKYPGKKLVFLYDHSSVHKKRADDALDAKRLNVRPGGKQPVFHDTILLDGSIQTFTFPNNHPEYPGLAKGAKQIAVERNLETKGLLKDQLVELLSACDDFKKEKKMLEIITEERGHTCLFLPKFHCEFNWCELAWANSKRWCRLHNADNLPTLEKNIPQSFETITEEMSRKTYQHCMEEIAVSFQNHENRKVAMKVYKSHRPPLGQLPHLHLLIPFEQLEG